MVFTERYGSPHTRIIDLISAWDIPFGQVGPQDKICIFTDSAMDPLVWESALAALKLRGAQATLCMFPRLAHHNADPPSMAIGAAKEADVLVALTTTALNSGTPGLRQIRAEGGGTGRTPIWLMEEMTVEILTEGGGSVTQEEFEQVTELQRRVGEIYDKGKWIRVQSSYGSDLVAQIDGYAPGFHANRWGKLPFQRNKETGRLGNGTWPWGEVHTEPVPGTANGTLIWDTTAHHPPGLWREPVKLTIKDGKVTDIEGGVEANEVIWHLKTNGDENSWLVGGEIALGTNHRCPPYTGQLRSEKKRYGAMHFGIGHGADRGIIKSKIRCEGIISRVSIIVDDDIVVCDNGVIKV
jgi:aminopeptidase